MCIRDSSEFVIDAVPNADGQRYAYLVGNCTSYEKQHVVIANLANSSTVSIGLNTTRCHFITKPAWSSNGSQLTFSYSPPTLAKNTFSAQGGCQMPLAGEVAIVPTSRSAAREDVYKRQTDRLLIFASLEISRSER